MASILPKLKQNKGTVSSALGKELAKEVLNGKKEILKEAVELLKHEDKNIRSGVGKIIEKVAEEKSELVASYIENLFVGLDVPEAQTRWMIFHTLGLCAKFKPETAMKAFDKATQVLKADSGTCLWGGVIKYFAYLGECNEEYAKKSFSQLEKAFETTPNLTKQVLEGYEKLIPVLDNAHKEQLNKIAEKYLSDARAIVVKTAKRIIKTLNMNSNPSEKKIASKSNKERKISDSQSVLKKISYYQNRRDEIPNQELAKELVESKNKAGIKEIAENLFNKEKLIGNCCIKVLYEIGYVEPELISDYVDYFLKLIQSKVNRQIWGGMVALSTIAKIRHKKIFENVDLIMKIMADGSKITSESGFLTLCNLASVNEKYNESLFAKILKHLEECEIKKVPAFAEYVYPAVNKNNKDDFARIVLERKSHLEKASQVKRIDKLLKKVGINNLDKYTASI